jgi:hypothetical protein
MTDFLLKMGIKKKIQIGGYEWSVIGSNTSDNTFLIITTDIINLKPFDDGSREVFWENCTLRKWLNDEFVSSFHKEERNRIVEVENHDLLLRLKFASEMDSKVKMLLGNEITDPGYQETTNDKIFVLSMKEMNEYLKGHPARCAKYKGKNYPWWLRTSAYSPATWQLVASIDGSTIISCFDKFKPNISYGIPANLDFWDVDIMAYNQLDEPFRRTFRNIENTGVGVRPAMWIKP